MEAPKLTSDQQQKTIRAAKVKQKKNVLRSTLFSPYSKLWPKVDPETSSDLIKTIDRILKPLDVGKLKDVETPAEMSTKEKVHLKKKARAEHWIRSKAFRSEIRLGINEVTRAAEKDTLAAMLVCASTSPIKMTEHFVQLCQKNKILGLAIENLGLNLSRLLNFNSCRAIGFHKSVEDSSSPLNEIYLTILRTAGTVKNVEPQERNPVKGIADVEATSESASKTTAKVEFEKWYIYKGCYPKQYKFRPGPEPEEFISLDTRAGIGSQPSTSGGPARKKVKVDPVKLLPMRLKQVQPRKDKKKIQKKGFKKSVKPKLK